MSRRKSLSKYACYAGIAYAVVAICMIFLAAVSYKVGNEVTTYSGLQVVFGYKATETVLGSKVSVEILDFSFMNLLPYILLIVGLVLAVMNLLGKGNKLMTIIACACFVIAGILLLLTVSLCVPHVNEVLGNNVPVLDKEKMSLGIGAILGGIFAILAGVAQVPKLLNI